MALELTHDGRLPDFSRKILLACYRYLEDNLERRFRTRYESDSSLLTVHRLSAPRLYNLGEDDRRLCEALSREGAVRRTAGRTGWGRFRNREQVGDYGDWFGNDRWAGSGGDVGLPPQARLELAGRAYPLPDEIEVVLPGAGLRCRSSLV